MFSCIQIQGKPDKRVLLLRVASVRVAQRPDCNNTTGAKNSKQNRAYVCGGFSISNEQASSYWGIRGGGGRIEENEQGKKKDVEEEISVLGIL